MQSIPRTLLALAVICSTMGLAAQDTSASLPAKASEEKLPRAKTTIPAGAEILVALKSAISTKSAKIGDPVYASTSFPYVQNEKVLIPAGTYVQGRITRITRPGRVKGRAELLIHFTTLIYPSGYTLLLPGGIENIPGAEHATVKGEEGTIQQNGEKGHDMGTVAGTAATGTVIGAAAGGLKGAGVGAATGGALGLAIALLSRGNDVRLESGTTLQMVIQRAVDVDADRVEKSEMNNRLVRVEQ